jgi:phospholipase C
VPAVIVSPWVKKGTVIHGSPDGESQYEHSSVAATVVHKLFKPKHEHVTPSYLTKRDEWAKTFEWVFQTEDAVRTDCPLTATAPPSHRVEFPHTLPVLNGLGILSHMQQGLVMSVARMTGDKDVTEKAVEGWTELQGSDYVTQRVASFLASE